LTGGQRDYAHGERIANLLEDRRQAFRDAERRPRALVRADPRWRFICLLAERLIKRGIVLRAAASVRPAPLDLPEPTPRVPDLCVRFYLLTGCLEG
jgi:hypothetical protein